MSLFEMSGFDDRLGQLRHLRGVLSEAIDSCESGRDLAALSLRFQSVVAEIEELAGSGGSESPADEIAARRRARSA